jgi:hypothetical protein
VAIFLCFVSKLASIHSNSNFQIKERRTLKSLPDIFEARINVLATEYGKTGKW